MTQTMDELLEDEVLLNCRLNGAICEELVVPGLSLLDFLRDQQRLTGTHMGCMTGHCGACTVLIDGEVAKSCLVMAASAAGKNIQTIEGLSPSQDNLSTIQQAFRDANSFQCGYCAPGMVLTTVSLLGANPQPSDHDIREALSGNLCRCTGYRSIVAGVRLAAERLLDGTATPALSESM
jgi:aerobic carbon-monoxide dehydrogenase small subunit